MHLNHATRRDARAERDRALIGQILWGYEMMLEVSYYPFPSRKGSLSTTSVARTPFAVGLTDLPSRPAGVTTGLQFHAVGSALIRPFVHLKPRVTTITLSLRVAGSRQGNWWAPWHHETHRKRAHLLYTYHMAPSASSHGHGPSAGAAHSLTILRLSHHIVNPPIRQLILSHSW